MREKWAVLRGGMGLSGCTHLDWDRNISEDL